MSYVRKTANPNMGWSIERRAKYSKQCKEAHANGTRHKISKKAVSLAISKGKKEAVKRKNRSEGQKRRHQETEIFHSLTPKLSGKILVDVDDQTKFEKILEVERVEQFEREDALWGLEIATIKDVRILFNLMEEHFGFQPSLNQFIEDAIGDKVTSITAELCKKLQS